MGQLGARHRSKLLRDGRSLATRLPSAPAASVSLLNHPRRTAAD